MADLGNKANPFLAGLTGLGEGLFQGYLLRKKQEDEQNQFNQRMAMQERQNSLMNAFRQADDLRAQQQFEWQKEYQKGLLGDKATDNQRLADALALREKALEEKTNYGNELLGIKKSNLELQQELFDLRRAKENRLEGDNTTNDLWNPSALVRQTGKTKKIYPYNQAGMDRLRNDVLQDPELAKYIYNLAKDNKIQDTETLQREIARHTQNKYYGGGKGFTDDQLLKLDEFSQLFGQFIQQQK